jgi:hypothetical protein
MKTAEDVCWEKIQILIDALDEIITSKGNKDTLKKIARKAIKQLPEEDESNA